MPKVSKKAGAALLVEAAPMAIERGEEAGASSAEAWEAEPLKPQFAPLNAFDQSGKKIEFRRVWTLSGRSLCHLILLLLLSKIILDLSLYTSVAVAVSFDCKYTRRQKC